jgi:hypothetical protein
VERVELMKRARAHVARLDLSAAQVAVLDGQAHTARALWNLLHEYVTFRQGRLASLVECDAAIRAARHEIDWMGRLPAQAAQAVLKTYRQAWVNFFNPEHPAERPVFKTRLRSRMAVDVPQARDLRVRRVNRRWGAVSLPKVGRVRFRWTRDLPGLAERGPAGRITGARLVKDAFGWSIVFRTETMAAPVMDARPDPAARSARTHGPRSTSMHTSTSDGTASSATKWPTSSWNRAIPAIPSAIRARLSTLPVSSWTSMSWWSSAQSSPTNSIPASKIDNGNQQPAGARRRPNGPVLTTPTSGGTTSHQRSTAPDHW